MQELRRRTNPDDMTVIEQLINVKEQICDKFCKYRNEKMISQETLDAICEHDCPMRKL